MIKKANNLKYNKVYKEANLNPNRVITYWVCAFIDNIFIWREWVVLFVRNKEWVVYWLKDKDTITEDVEVLWVIDMNDKTASLKLITKDEISWQE